MGNITSEAEKAFNKIMSETAFPQDTSVVLPKPSDTVPNGVYLNTPSPVKNDISDLLFQLNSDNIRANAKDKELEEEARRKAMEEEEKRLAEERAKALAQKAKEEEKLRQSVDEEVNRRVKEKEEELRKSILAENKPRFPFFRKKDKQAITVEEVKVKGVNTPEITSDSTDLARLAFTDEKFSINNANAYKKRLNDLGEAPADVIIINIDANNLKYVNDNFGHMEGDKFLSIIADNIKAFFGEDNSFRQGGDEFCAIIPINDNTSDSFPAKITEFNSLLTQKEKELNLKYPVSVSIGFAFSDGKSTLTELISKADSLMYEAKAKYHTDHPEYDMRGQSQQLPFTNLIVTPVFTFSDITDYLIINKDETYTVFLCDKDATSLWIFQDIDVCFDMLNDMEIERSAIGFCLIVTDKEYKFFGDDIDDVITLKPIIKASKSHISEKDLFLKYKQEIAYFDNVYI